MFACETLEIDENETNKEEEDKSDNSHARLKNNKEF